MRKLHSRITPIVISLIAISLTSCAHNGTSSNNSTSASTGRQDARAVQQYVNYESRIPSHINTNGQRTIVIDPRVHVWGAYDGSGNLVKAGLASAGSSWCADIGRACKTRSGTFRIQSLGNAGCKSTIYPKPRGGAPMPYCMFFNGNVAMHGSPASHVVEGNVSHGCVRLRVHDAEWIRHNFANVGTKVIVRSY